MDKVNQNAVEQYGEFTDNLRRLRREKKLTQVQLAEKVGVTACTVQNWENGRAFPQPDMREQIANVLSIPKEKQDDFFLRTDKSDEAKNADEKTLLDKMGITENCVGKVASHEKRTPFNPFLRTALIALGCWSAALIVVALFCKYVRLDDLIFSSPIVYINEITIIEWKELTAVLILSFAVFTGIPMVIHIFSCKRKKSGINKVNALLLAAAIAVFAPFVVANGSTAEESDGTKTYTANVDGKGSSCVYVNLDIALVETGGASVEAILTNAFTLFPSTVAVRLCLYSSSEKTSDVSEMTLEGMSYSSDLNMGESIIVTSLTYGADRYWTAHAVYYKSAKNMKIYRTNSVFFKADGTYDPTK